MAHSVRIFDDHSVMDNLLRNAKQLKGAYVKCGYPANIKVASPSKKGSKHKPYADSSELATIATTNEYGSISKNIPARPTVGPSVDKNRNKLKSLQAKLIDKVFAGKMSVETALDVLGEFMVAAIKREISLLVAPVLSPKTIKRKRSTKPLIDSAQMRNSVNYTRHST